MGTATLITLFFGELTFRLLLQQQEQRTATSKYMPSTHNNSQVQFGKVWNYRCEIAVKKEKKVAENQNEYTSVPNCVLPFAGFA